MRTFEEDLEAAAAYHGHICSGIVLGVRLARLALRRLGIDDPLHYRDLIVYVEMDRCVADAVGMVTGCSLGRRCLKWIDYGKPAASFVDLLTGRAVRVAVAGDAPFPGEEDVVAFWQAIPDEAIFRCQDVSIDIHPDDLPGRPRHMVNCQACGEQVLDGREEAAGGRILCHSCAHGSYYRPL